MLRYMIFFSLLLVAPRKALFGQAGQTRGKNIGVIITYTILGAPQYIHRDGHQNPNLIIKAPTLPCWPSHASAEGSRRPELPGTSSLRPLMSLHAYILLRLLRSVSI